MTHEPIIDFIDFTQYAQMWGWFADHYVVESRNVDAEMMTGTHLVRAGLWCNVDEITDVLEARYDEETDVLHVERSYFDDAYQPTERYVIPQYKSQVTAWNEHLDEFDV